MANIEVIVDWQESIRKRRASHNCDDNDRALFDGRVELNSQS